MQDFPSLSVYSIASVTCSGGTALVLSPLHHIRCSPARRTGCRTEAGEWVLQPLGLPSQDRAGSQPEKHREKMERGEVCVAVQCEEGQVWHCDVTGWCPAS